MAPRLALACGALAAALALAPATALAQSTTTSAIEVKPPPPEPKRSVVPAVVLGVLAAGGIGSGIGLMSLSSARSAEADAVRSMIVANYGSCVSHWLSFSPKPCVALQDNLHAADTFHNVSVGTFIAGGAAAAGTVIYLLWPQHRREEIRLTPVLAPTTTGLLVAGSF